MSHLPVLFGYHASNLGNSHVPLSLCRHWHNSGRDVSLTVPSNDPALGYSWLKPAMSGLAKKVVYRLGYPAIPRRIAERFFLKTEKQSPYVYLWAGLSLEIFEEFERRGATIIIERINCHRHSAQRILQQASEHWNIPVTTAITSEAIEEENRKLDIADAVFCPSPMVRNSMLENNVDESKLLSTSYGWSPERFPSREKEPSNSPRPVFLFAGTICLRKGIPLLLEAWKRADLNAELLLCGSIAHEIQEHYPSLESIKNVRHVNYTRDIGQLYRKTDVFVFPSLEEGGPMVTYEAMAHGIPPLVTAMGGGAIVENTKNGTILPDMDIDAWAQAMTLMAENPDRRKEIGNLAQQRSKQFTWKQVAEQRARLLEEHCIGIWKTKEAL